MATWQFPSKSSKAIHTVTHAENGLLGCTCRGWTMKKRGKVRECSHTKHVIASEGLVPEIRGDYVFAAHPKTIPVKAIQAVAIEQPSAQPLTAPESQLASAMTTSVTGAAFDAKYGDGAWMMEEKLDGHRCAVVKVGAVVKAWSRLGNEKTLPASIVEDLTQMPDGIYDGELVVPGGQSWNVTELDKQDDLILVLFDVLEVLGHSVTHEPQSMRRQLLIHAQAHVKDSDVVTLAAEFPPSWATVEKLWKHGSEGVIVKRQSATYRPGYRTDAWLKVKKLQSMVGVVTGFEQGSFGPHAVTLLKLDNGKDARVKTKDNYWLNEIAKAPESFIGRRLVIQFQTLTPSGSPRHPMWDHFAGEFE